jgi:hypothetical protein
MELVNVEVCFENLQVEAGVFVGARGVPTVINAYLNALQVHPSCLHLTIIFLPANHTYCDDCQHTLYESWRCGKLQLPRRTPDQMATFRSRAFFDKVWMDAVGGTLCWPPPWQEEATPNFEGSEWRPETGMPMFTSAGWACMEAGALHDYGPVMRA